MGHCSDCGAPLEVGDQAVRCGFCGVLNAPPPREIAVPVPVQVVNTIVQAAPSDAPVERRCPHCRRRLVTVVAEGVALSGCGACGGIWVDNASARKVLANPLPVFADLARRAAVGASGSRGKSDKPVCAECPAILDRATVHGVTLDTCVDHGTWFDALELETLVRTLRHEPVLPAQAPTTTILCQGCGKLIESARANLTEYGLRCEGCWRAEQAELESAFDADNRKRAVLVGGALLGITAAMLGAASSSSNRS